MRAGLEGGSVGGSEDADSAAAAAMGDARTEINTKNRYRSCVVDSMIWFQAKRPDCLNTQQTEFVIPIPVDALIKFFGHLCSPAHQRSAMREGEKLGDDDVEPPPYSSVSLYRSAIFDLWKQLKIPVPADTTLQLKRILDGYEKVLNNLRRRGLAKITEGKKDLGFDGYRMHDECLQMSSVWRNLIW
jgi:hypothetical protein